MKYIFFIISILYASSIKLNKLQSSLSKGKKTTYVFGHKSPDTDSIVSAILMAHFEENTGNENTVIPCRLGDLNKETEYVLNYFDVEAPVLISKATEADEVILVDHNVPEQSTDDIGKVKVAKLIDHHGLTGFKFPKPIFILTKPVGSTATILYELFQSNDVEITKRIAGLMLSAIISDTILLKSAITTEEDIKAVKELAEIADIDYEDYGFKMLVKGTEVSDYSVDAILNMDSKRFKVNGIYIQIAFLNSVDVKDVLKRKEEFLKAMKKYIEENDLKLFVFNILDMINMDSTALVEGELSYAVEKAFNVQIVDHEVFLPGISSRKTQLFPFISKAIEEGKSN